MTVWAKNVFVNFPPFCFGPYKIPLLTLRAPLSGVTLNRDPAVCPDRSVRDNRHNQTMSAELDLSPPEVPEPTFLESLLRYGLFLGAIFQLICILAVIFPTSKGNEHVGVHRRPGVGLWLSFTVGISTPSLFFMHKRAEILRGALQNKCDIVCYEY